MFPIGNFEIYWSPIIHDLYSNPVIMFGNINKLKNISKNSILASIYFLMKQININSNIIIQILKNNFEWITKKYELISTFDKNLNKNDINSENIFNILDDSNLNNKLETDLLKFADDIGSDILKDVYIKGDLLNAIKSKNEIMVDCKSYYLINPKYYLSIKNKLF